MVAVVLGTALSALGGAAEARTVQDLSRYCTACWRNARLPADRWNDCTQEVLVRLLERVPTVDWERTLPPKARSGASSCGPSTPSRSASSAPASWRTTRTTRSPTSVPRTRSRAGGARAARASPPTRCSSERQQHILQLTIEGWSVPEIADELGTTAERVSDEKYKAIRKLRTHLAGRDEAA